MLVKPAQAQKDRIKDIKDFPKAVLIDTISFCNLQCSMCVHKDMKRKRGVMEWPLFTKIIDEIAATDKNTRVWMVFFGEALLLKRKKPSIFDMISYAKNKGLTDVVLNSNANLLDKKASEDLISSGLDAIFIGLDAFKPETYAKVRVGGNHKQTVENILYLLKLKKEKGLEHPKVYVQFVEMEINKNEKNDFIDFWKQKGAIVKIRPKVSWAGSISAHNLVLTNKDRWPCHWAMQTISITDTGDVVTCAVDLDARFVAGNIRNGSIKDIWKGKLGELRKLHLTKEFDKLPAFCRDCRDWQSAKADYYEDVK